MKTKGQEECECVQHCRSSFEGVQKLHESPVCVSVCVSVLSYMVVSVKCSPLLHRHKFIKSAPQEEE